MLLTAGADVGSSSTLAETVAGASKRHVALFTVGLGTHADTTVLQGLAEATGGAYVPASESNVETIYRQLAGQLSSQYVLVYRSQAPGGAEVTVAVSAAGGKDQSFIQLPRLPSTPEPGFSIADLFKGQGGLIAVVALAFTAIFLFSVTFVGGAARARRNRMLSRRIAAPSLDEAPATAQPGSGSWIPAPLVQAGDAVAEMGGFASGLESTLERAGLPVTPGELVAGSVTAGVLVAVASLLLVHSWLVAAVLALVALSVPFLLVRKRKTNRLEQLHEQLPDVLMILASSMRAGHSFLQALDAVAKEIGEPSNVEFSRVVTEIRLGRPANEALMALGERVGTEEYRWTMLAVNVQSEVGGNLAEILDTLADTVREREAVRRQVRVFSADGRLSMRIMAIMPPLLAVVVWRLNPEYMRPLFETTIGHLLIAGAVVLEIVGTLVARKVVKIDV